MYIGKKGEENQTTAAVAPPSTLGLLLIAYSWYRQYLSKAA